MNPSLHISPIISDLLSASVFSRCRSCRERHCRHCLQDNVSQLEWGTAWGKAGPCLWDEQNRGPSWAHVMDHKKDQDKVRLSIKFCGMAKIICQQKDSFLLCSVNSFSKGLYSQEQTISFFLPLSFTLMQNCDPECFCRLAKLSRSQTSKCGRRGKSWCCWSKILCSESWHLNLGLVLSCVPGAHVGLAVLNIWWIPMFWLNFSSDIYIFPYFPL